MNKSPYTPIHPFQAFLMKLYVGIDEAFESHPNKTMTGSGNWEDERSFEALLSCLFWGKMTSACYDFSFPKASNPSDFIPSAAIGLHYTEKERRAKLFY